MLHALRRLLVGERLALKQNHVGTGDAARISGGFDLYRAITSDADDTQPARADRVDVLGPGVDQGDVQSAFGEQAAEQTAHGAGADDHDAGLVEAHVSGWGVSRWRGRR